MLVRKIGNITCKMIIPCFGCVLVLSLTVTVCADVDLTDVTSSSPAVVVELVWITVKIEIFFNSPFFIKPY